MISRKEWEYAENLKRRKFLEEQENEQRRLFSHQEQYIPPIRSSPKPDTFADLDNIEELQTKLLNNNFYTKVPGGFVFRSPTGTSVFIPIKETLCF